MFGIQLIRLLDVLRVNTVRNAIGVVPRSLIITGDDFSSVEKVLINGDASPDFVVYSRTELAAQVPDQLADAFITNVSVLSSGLTFTEKSLVEFTFGTRPKKVRGILRLMQTFLRILLRTPGSNVFHRRSGGGLALRVGDNITSRTAADVAIAINTTRQYIIGVQTSERSIPPSERLLSAEIMGLSADRQNTQVAVTVVLTSHAGARSAATIST